MTAPDALAVRVVETLRGREVTLATSESLTGGLLGASVTAVPGASEVYLGGVIAYQTAMKSRLSAVPAEVVRACGVVSEQTVTEMALGVQSLTGADWAIAVTGVAGPTPQEGHDPGEVWIGLAGPRMGTLEWPVRAHVHRFAGDRDSVRRQTVTAALELLLAVLSPVG